MTIDIPSFEALPAAAREFLAAALTPSAAAGDAQPAPSSRIVAFYGPMGAGKTTFIAALCRELGVGEPVTSPTFAIVNEYRSSADGPLRGEAVFHFDFYRIRSLGEVRDIGFDDYLYSGALCLIEWPELVEELLPDDVVRVRIAEDPATHGRTLSW